MSAPALPITPHTRPKVLLADEHTLLLEGLSLLLQDHFHLVGCVSNHEALLRAAKQLVPDVIVAELILPQMEELEAIGRLRQLGCRARVVVLTRHVEIEVALQAFRCGVCGYVLKQGCAQELIDAIQEVVQGRAYLTPYIAVVLH